MGSALDPTPAPGGHVWAEDEFWLTDPEVQDSFERPRFWSAGTPCGRVLRRHALLPGSNTKVLLQ